MKKKNKMKICHSLNFLDSSWAFDKRDVNYGDEFSPGAGDLSLNLKLKLDDKNEITISFWSTHYMIRFYGEGGVSKWSGKYRPNEINKENWLEKIKEIKNIGYEE